MYIKFLIFFTIIFTIISINIHLFRSKFIKDFDFIRLDKSQAPNETVILEKISNEMSHLPIEDLNNEDYQYRNINSTCAWYPSFADIQIHNDYWQEFHNTNITYFIFNAYLDRRPTVVKNEPVIRIITMIHFISPNDTDYPKTYCQLWYEEQSEPIIVETQDLRRIWYYEWGHGPENNYGHLLTCALPKEQKDWIPKTVSLVAQPCDKATNNVRVTYIPLKDQQVKQEFAVCVKALNYPHIDMSHRFVEYIETLRILGAKKIIFYGYQIHPNATKVLNYYAKENFIEYYQTSSSSETSNLAEYRNMGLSKNYFPYMLHEVIPYTDCLYRNMYLYDYVAAVDIDEVIMPLSNFTNWHDLVEFGEHTTQDNCNKFASFCFLCTYFPRYPEKPKYSKEIPEYLYMLQHVERVREHRAWGEATKCLHNTNRVISLHNHFSMHQAEDVCGSYTFSATKAQLNHYREPDDKEALNNPIIDTSLWRYKDEITKRSMKVFEDLNFINRIKPLFFKNENPVFIFDAIF